MGSYSTLGTPASKRKRILFISPHIPFPLTEGGRIRTYALLKGLGREFEVDFVALGNSPRLLSMEQLDAVSLTMMERWPDALRQGAIKLKANPGSQPVSWILGLPLLLYLHCKAGRILRNMLLGRRFDAVVFDYTKMARYLGFIGGAASQKILHVHNAESDTARQMMLNAKKGMVKCIYWLQWKLFEGYEKRFVPLCDLLLAPSREDADFYHRLAPNIQTAVVPNAVDTEALKPLGDPEEPFSLIYPARMDYPPNIEAVHIFCEQILPRVAQTFPSVRFYVVGKNPPRNIQELASDPVVVTGYVDDVLPYWRKASALVVPLSIGGGTRIKILEAMALGRPVVSTSKGCEGLEVAHQKHLLIADDPKEFAECVIQVLRNPDRFHEMVLAARRLVEEKYSFTALAAMLQEALEESSSEM